MLKTALYFDTKNSGMFLLAVKLSVRISKPTQRGLVLTSQAMVQIDQSVIAFHILVQCVLQIPAGKQKNKSVSKGLGGHWDRRIIKSNDTKKENLIFDTPYCLHTLQKCTSNLHILQDFPGWIYRKSRWIPEIKCCMNHLPLPKMIISKWWHKITLQHGWMDGWVCFEVKKMNFFTLMHPMCLWTPGVRHGSAPAR